MIKTGITVDNFLHHSILGFGVFALSNRCNAEARYKRTVNGDGNALVESVAIGTDEGWDLSKAIELQVFSWNTLGWLGLDDLELDIVCFRNSLDGS